MHKKFKVGMDVLVQGRKGKIVEDRPNQLFRELGACVQFEGGSTWPIMMDEIEIIPPTNYKTTEGVMFADVIHNLSNKKLPKNTLLVCEYGSGEYTTKVTYKVVVNGNVRRLTEEGEDTGVSMWVADAQIFGDWTIKIPQEPKYHLVAKFDDRSYLNRIKGGSKIRVSDDDETPVWQTEFTQQEADEILSGRDFASFKKQLIGGNK